jgi:hypothetical protein
MNDELRLRMLEDLLEAERNFRDLAERRARALAGVLTELAYRMDGERLERLRQLDPSAPGTWQPEEWRNFFAGLPQKSNGWGQPCSDGSHQKEISALQARIASLERELAQARLLAAQAAEEKAKAESKAEAKIAPSPATAITTDRLSGFVMPKIPAAYAHRWMVRGQMSKADEELHLKRRGMVLKCLADGLNVQVEIGRYVGDATGAQYRSGAIRRVFESLEESGLIVRQTLKMSVSGNLPTRLSVARLSQEGRQMCRALGWEVRESDWERLDRLHQGQNQEEHTLSVLLFAASARLRGWKVTVLPEVEGVARPDLLIESDSERWYVEVETGTRLHEDNSKWRMNAELNGGKIALVARNVEERRVLISDCQHIADHGVATDIETIIKDRFVDVTADSPIWAETW